MDVQLPLVSKAWQAIKNLISGQTNVSADSDSVEGKLSLKEITQLYPRNTPIQSEIEKCLLYNPIKPGNQPINSSLDESEAKVNQASTSVIDGKLTNNLSTPSQPFSKQNQEPRSQVENTSSASKSLFIGRDTQQQKVVDAINRWKNNKGELTAIIGPFGSGVSSFLNQFHNQYHQTEPVTYLSFYHAALSAKEAIANLCYCFNITDEPKSITAAISLINQQESHIIIIDDLHKLMLRMMGNYQALVTFATIIMETRQQHCWILGCETYVWHRLSSQYSITNFVKIIVRLDYFSALEFRDIVESKTAQIGLKLTLDSDDENEKSAVEQLSKQLHQVSGGHSKLACILLFNALAEDGNHPLSLQPICTPDTTTLKQCSDEDLFSLAELYVHGGLRIFQHAEIFACSVEQSSLKLEYLSRQGLLKAHYSKQDFAQHYYAIAPSLTRIIANHLLNHNKLYL
ncbi:ATP-binding protein [Shewanella olleyana]|uniref:ATP-binding protein n=1 Tax=Shewanella olleyana TaxID=135626 RepID=UPI00200F21F1|nr:ATP-binding protein [Shewanella olleyana]MCL1066713.1 ATP-binding protein [Shewanella olleyana]